ENCRDHGCWADSVRAAGLRCVRSSLAFNGKLLFPSSRVDIVVEERAGEVDQTAAFVRHRQRPSDLCRMTSTCFFRQFLRPFDQLGFFLIKVNRLRWKCELNPKPLRQSYDVNKQPVPFA
ncbi:unnamed protein product, partial [Symbiodinium sp. CCMP2456]